MEASHNWYCSSLENYRLMGMRVRIRPFPQLESKSDRVLKLFAKQMVLRYGNRALYFPLTKVSTLIIKWLQ